jgi:hypothetical protein
MLGKVGRVLSAGPQFELVAVGILILDELGAAGDDVSEEGRKARRAALMLPAAGEMT